MKFLSVLWGRRDEIKEGELRGAGNGGIVKLNWTKGREKAIEGKDAYQIINLNGSSLTVILLKIFIRIVMVTKQHFPSPTSHSNEEKLTEAYFMTQIKKNVTRDQNNLN